MILRQSIAVILLLSAFGVRGAVAFETSSLLAEGRWVKIRVDSTGVYRLSPAMLSAMGFDTSGAITIAGYGSVERAHTLDTGPDDLPVIPVMRMADGSICFYGEGSSRLIDTGSITQPEEHRNLYSGSSYYFVTDRPDLHSPDLEETDGTIAWEQSIIDTHTYLERRRYTRFHPFGAGAFLYSSNIKSTSGPVTEKWTTTDVVDGTMTLSYSFIGMTGRTSATTPTVTISGATSTPVSTTGIRGTSNENVVYVASDVQKYRIDSCGDEIEFTVSDPNNYFSMLALDNVTMRYITHNRWRGSQQIWNLYGETGECGIEVTGAPAGAMAWDVTSPRRPIALSTALTETGRTIFGADLHQGFSTQLVLFDAAKLPEPTVEGEVSPQELHAISGVDMLIVTTRAAQSEAERLAAAHREIQGLEVAVAPIDEVANEFSSGAWHPAAVRRLVLKLSQSGLRHLLLMGYGTPQTLAPGQPFPDGIMVTFHTEYVDEDRYNSRNHCSDTYFVTLTDRIDTRITAPSTQYSINVGRAPVRSKGEAAAFVDKCIRYLTDPSLSGNPGETLLFSLYGDSNKHLNSMLRQAEEIESQIPGATIHHGHNSLFPIVKVGTTVTSPLHYNYMLSAIGSRISFFNFSGHSSPRCYGFNFNDAFINDARFASMPLLYTSGCSTSVFDKRSSIGADLAVSAYGPIAVVGTTREVYLDNNHTLNNKFVDALFTATPDMTIGDVYRIALNTSHSTASTSSARDQVINNCCYHLLGDPALPVYRSSATMKLTTVDGATSYAGKSLKSLTPSKLAGTVNKADGSIDETFDGTATVTIFAPPVNQITVSTDASDIAAGKVMVTTDDIELFRGSCTVNKGRWELTATPPAVDSIGGVRITFHAFSADKRIAFGSTRNLAIAHSDGGLTQTDTQAPTITLTLDGETDPIVTGPTPLLKAVIADKGTGINFNRASIGTAPSIKLDGVALSGVALAFRAGGEGEYLMEVLLPELSQGSHTLEATATDIAGNCGSAAINFLVDSTPLTAELSASTALTRDEVTFDVETSTNVAYEAILMVNDSAGNTAARIEGVSFPYTWDFTLDDGTIVADGTYRASVLLKSAGRYAATREVEFTFVKK